MYNCEIWGKRVRQVLQYFDSLREDYENKVWNSQLCTISKVLVQSLYNIYMNVIESSSKDKIAT